jgi:hypothetical protein
LSLRKCQADDWPQADLAFGADFVLLAPSFNFP